MNKFFKKVFDKLTKIEGEDVLREVEKKSMNPSFVTPTYYIYSQEAFENIRSQPDIPEDYAKVYQDVSDKLKIYAEAGLTPVVAYDYNNNRITPTSEENIKGMFIQ